MHWSLWPFDVLFVQRENSNGSGHVRFVITCCLFIYTARLVAARHSTGRLMDLTSSHFGVFWAHSVLVLGSSEFVCKGSDADFHG